MLVGRGAGFMLPRETTLSVRIIAPLKVRAIRLAERMGVSVRTARRAAKDLDNRRAQFDRTMHRMTSADPHNYDLTLDAHSLSLEIAAEIIVRAVEAGRPGASPNSWALSTTTVASTATAGMATAPLSVEEASRLAYPETSQSDETEKTGPIARQLD